MPAFFRRLFGRVGRRFWIWHIDRVLSQAYQDRIIDSWTLHELDARLKYEAFDRERARPFRNKHYDKV